MPTSENLQCLIEKLTRYVERKADLGLLPPYLWIKKSVGAVRAAPASGMGPPLQISGEITKIDTPDKIQSLQNLREKIGDCTRCRLHQGRTKLVFGVGNPHAKLMFIGEAPGRDEDLKGEPFVGRAGQLLTKIIEAMGFQRSEIYIANIVKCRPPENRNPAPDEIATCSPFLLEQIETIQPRVIVCLGNFAAQTILATEQKITSLRGKLHLWPSATVREKLGAKIPLESIQLMPTYHPAFLLRNPNMKKPVWEDMKIVMETLKKY